MKYEIKQLNATDAVVISDEEIKINDPITDGYKIWYQRDNYSLLNRKKIIATISPFKIEGLPILELPKNNICYKNCLIPCNGDCPRLPNQEEDFILLNKVIEEESEIAYLQTGSLTSIEIVKRAASAGYKAAQKQYSEDDVRNAFKAGRKKQSTNPSGEYEFDTVDDYLQSLQKKQFPIAVELTKDFKPLKWYYE